MAVLGSADVLHPEGLTSAPSPSVHPTCTKHRTTAGSRGLERSPKDSSETTWSTAFPQLADRNSLVIMSGQGQGRTAGLPLFAGKFQSSAAHAHAVVVAVLNPTETLIAARQLAGARPHLTAVAGIVHHEDLWQLCRDELTGVDVRSDGWDIRGRWFGVVVVATPRLGQLRRGEAIPWRVIAAQLAPRQGRGLR